MQVLALSSLLPEALTLAVAQRGKGTQIQPALICEKPQVSSHAASIN